MQMQARRVPDVGLLLAAAPAHFVVEAHVEPGRLLRPVVDEGGVAARLHDLVERPLQRDLDDRFKATNHQNVYFPLLIP